MKSQVGLILIVALIASACQNDAADDSASSAEPTPPSTQLSQAAGDKCGDLIAAIDSEDSGGASEAVSGLMGLLSEEPDPLSPDENVMYGALKVFGAMEKDNGLDFKIGMNQLITDCLSPREGQYGRPPSPTQGYSQTTQDGCIDLFRALDGEESDATWKAVDEALASLTHLGSDTVDPRIFALAAAHQATLGGPVGTAKEERAEFDATFPPLIEGCADAVGVVTSGPSAP